MHLSSKHVCSRGLTRTPRPGFLLQSSPKSQHPSSRGGRGATSGRRGTGGESFPPRSGCRAESPESGSLVRSSQCRQWSPRFYGAAAASAPQEASGCIWQGLRVPRRRPLAPRDTGLHVGASTRQGGNVQLWWPSRCQPAVRQVPPVPQRRPLHPRSNATRQVLLFHGWEPEAQGADRTCLGLRG